MVKSAGGNTTVIRLLLVIVAALVLFGLFTYYNRNKMECFSTPSVASQPSPVEMRPLLERSATPPQPVNDGGVAAASASFAPRGVEPKSNEGYLPAVPRVDGPSTLGDPFPQDRTAPEDLLPRDAANSKFAQANPAGQGDLKDVNFLNAGFHVGVNTQGQSLRNASHDLRSEPSNPRYKVSIWNSSTIESDLNRRPLE
jgi:hypothetical protein